MIRLRTLGELLLADEDGPIQGPQRKDLVLLTYVARRAPRPVPREELAALLWGERQEARARHSLRQSLVRLRKALGAALVEDAAGITVSPDRLELDLAVLEREISEGRLEPGLTHWAGGFLPGADDAGGPDLRVWIEQEREGMRRRLGWVLERLVEGAEARGDWAEAVARAEEWASLHPLEEPPHIALVRALRLAGRPADALACHGGFIQRLRLELDEAPSLAFQRLAAELPDEDGAPGALRTVPASEDLRPSALVGRETEFLALTSHRDICFSGEGRLVLVEGPPGIGRSRLCHEFLAWLLRSGDPFFLLHAQAFASESRARLGVARELLAGIVDTSGLGGAPNEALGELSHLVPSLRARFPHLPQPSRRLASLRNALVRVVADVAAETPVVLFVDDLPAADLASRDLLFHLFRHLPGRVLVLVTAGRGSSQELAELRELDRSGLLRIVRPGQLEVAEVETLVGSMLDLPPTDRHALALALHRDMGGIPFHLVRTLEAMLEVGSLEHSPEGGWRLREGTLEVPLPLPDAVRHRVNAEVDALPDTPVQILEAMASMDEPMSLADLAAITRHPPMAISLAVSTLVARGLLRPAPPPGTGVLLVGELHRRVLLERTIARRIGAPERAPVEEEESPDPQVGPTNGGPPRSDPVHDAEGRSDGAGRRRVAGIGALATVVAAVFWWGSSLRPQEPPVLAVGEISDSTRGTGAAEAGAVPLMLASHLAGLPGLEVVSSDRLTELAVRAAREREDRLVSPWDIAREAGAREILEGELRRGEDGRLHLRLRRVDLSRGVFRSSLTAEGLTVAELVEDASAKLARDMGLSPGESLPATVSTRSLIAYRFYEEGLRAYYQGDARTSLRLLEAATREDSAFAMAEYYAWRARDQLGMVPPFDTSLARAARLAEHATDRERLLIRAAWLDAMDDPRRLAVAETLAIRYPRDPDGHYLLGRGLLWNGEFLEAIPHLRKVIELDASALVGDHPRCLACDALRDLGTAYQLADSLPAAERVAREWARAQPRSSLPWVALATRLAHQDRYDEALEARRRAAPLQPGDPYDAIHPALVALRAGDHGRADRILRDRSESGPPDARLLSLWFLIVSLRDQGRVHAALSAGEDYRGLLRELTPGGPEPPFEGLALAQILLEAGRPLDAAALLDSIATSFEIPGAPARTARNRTWALTHLATARAAAGDTAALPGLAEAVAEIGSASGLGRDRLLQHYVRGLHLAAREEWDGAAEAFRAATFSPTGHSRLSRDHARALRMAGRPHDAVAVLRPAFRGSLESGNLYLTRTELHLELARALDAAGEPDSALVHYHRVERSWADADPAFQARRDSVAMRVRALTSR